MVYQSWLVTNLSKGIVDNLLTDEGKIHEGFSVLFREAIKSALDEDISELRDILEKRHERHVILFTGHSLGGALSQISSLYYAKHTADLIEQDLLQIRAVTFGTPAVRFFEFQRLISFTLNPHKNTSQDCEYIFSVGRHYIIPRTSQT